MTSATEIRTVALFTATDRCPARAAVLVVLRRGGEVAFRDHHLRRYRTALAPLALRFERHVELDDTLAFVPAPAGR